MGVFDRTVGRFAKAAQPTGAAMSTWQNGVAAMPNMNYEGFAREGYGKNELVYACIEEWATDIAEAQVAAYADGADGPVVVDSDAVRLLNRPNPWMSGDDLLGAIEMFKRLAGNAYVWKQRTNGGRVVELWLLRPDRVRIVPDAQRFIRAYEYRIGTAKFDLDPGDVIHFKTRHPYDDLYGMPPLMAASGRTDIDNFMKDIVKGYLQNVGIPAGVLQVAGRLDDQEKALLKSRFRQEHAGLNAGGIIVSDGGSDAPKFTAMGMPLGARGLVIPELDEIDEARICMVFRVPMSIIGTRLAQTSGVSYAARASDRQFFTEQELVPEWKSIASVWTAQLLPDFKGVATKLDYDLSTVRSLGENQDALSTRVLAETTAGVRSIEEARAALGLPVDPDAAHHFVMPFSSSVATWVDITTPLPAPIALPSEAARELPMGQQKRLPQVVVVNGTPASVRKLFEYDDDGNITAMIEQPVE